MVQLKDGAEKSTELINVLFQFLYGAIKSPVINSNIVASKLFQFLYGAIKSLSYEESSEAAKRISIPLWCN